MANKTLTFPEAGVDVLRLLAPSPREEHAKTAHYASTLEGCPRKEYYKWTTAPITNPTGESSILKMEAGNDAHDLFAMRLRRHFDEVQTEIPVELIDSQLVYPIHGRIDVLAHLQGAKYLMEYKSTQYRTTDRALEAPFDGHLLQLWAYMKIEEADHYYLIYEDRGSKLGIEYEVAEVDGGLFWRKNGTWAPTELSWAAVIEKLMEIEEAAGDHEPPERVDLITGQEFRAYLSTDGKKIQQTKTVDGEVFRSHWMCMGYCEYRDHCWLGVK